MARGAWDAGGDAGAPGDDGAPGGGDAPGGGGNFYCGIFSSMPIWSAVSLGRMSRLAAKMSRQRERLP